MKNTICKIFKHKFNYFISSTCIPSHHFKCCKRCSKIWEYKEIPVYGLDWYLLVQRTKQGAKEFFGETHL